MFLLSEVQEWVGSAPDENADHLPHDAAGNLAFGSFSHNSVCRARFFQWSLVARTEISDLQAPVSLISAIKKIA